MKTCLYLAFLSLFLASCSKQWCYTTYPPDTTSIETVIYRDTIIEVHVPGHDTVFKESTIRDTIIVHSGTAHGRSWVIHDTIKLMVWQTDTILSVKLDSAIKVINDKNTLIYTIKQKTKFERYLWLGIVIAGIILLIVLVPRVLKKK